MSKELFIFILLFILDFINEHNKNLTPENDDFIFLPIDLFDYNKDENKYYPLKNLFEIIKQSKFIFIGDNPGKNEKEHFKFFFKGSNWHTAGYKMNNFILKYRIDGESIFFNKCLIYTSKTSELKKHQVELTTPIVFLFLWLCKKINNKLILIFCGINGLKNNKSKFNDLYYLITMYLADFYFINHPCSSLFKLGNNRIKNADNINQYIKELKRLNKNFKFGKFKKTQYSELIAFILNLIIIIYYLGGNNGCLGMIPIR